MTPLVGLLLLAITFIVGVAIDIYLVMDNTSNNTWSEIIRLYSESSIMIPWVIGVLCGHWFHWFAEGQGFKSNYIWALVGTTLAVLCGSFLIHRFLDPFPNYILMITLQVGILMGALFWRV